MIHTVAPPMALIIKQARSAGLNIPIVTSSSLVEPTATALFEPAELADVCAETPSAPEARNTPAIKAWADAYEALRRSAGRSGARPVRRGEVAMTVIAAGAHTPERSRAALNTVTYHGVAMTYKSNGHGDMAHDADIVCWDGSSRIPHIAAHYAGDAAGPELAARQRSSRAAPMPLLQLALNGIALGAAYALVALGFVLVVNATGAVNFAHGDLVMAGGYAAVCSAPGCTRRCSCCCRWWRASCSCSGWRCASSPTSR